MKLRRIHPDAALIDVEEATESLGFADRALADRPLVVANMVTTADGRATIGGRSGPIGAEGDHALFHALRGAVDAVLAGTRTLEIERYGRLIRDPGAREARARRGLSPDPLACVVSRSGRLALDTPLFGDSASTVALYSGAAVDVGGCAATVHVTRMEPSRMSMRAVLTRLRSDHGVRSLLCEGGPTLLAGMLREGVVDELFLTLAPLLAGGEPALTAVSGHLPEPVDLKLVWALEDQGELLLRYAIERAS